MNAIDEYLKGVPAPMRSALQDLRATIAKAAPKAEEAISYSMPAFKYKGRVLVYFAAFKNHCSFFPASGRILETFKAELDGFRTSKGTLQFTPDKPIPKRTLQKIVKARMAEVDAKA